MANTLKNENELFESVRLLNAAMEPDICARLYNIVVADAVSMETICTWYIRANKPMPAEEMQGLLLFSRDMEASVDSILPGLNSALQELIAHHIGNDLSAINFIIGNYTDPLCLQEMPAAIINKINSHAISIRVFLEDVLRLSPSDWRAANILDYEYRSRNIYGQIGRGLIRADMNGRILYIDPDSRQRLGFEASEIAGLTQESLTAQSWRSTESFIMQEQVLKRGYSDEYKKELVRKDGIPLAIRIRLRLIKGGSGSNTQVCGIFSQEAVQKSTPGSLYYGLKELEHVIESIGVGITVSDKQGRFHIFNSKMQKISGYNIQDANSSDFSALIYPNPVQRAQALDGINKLNKEGQWRQAETLIRAKDGSEKTLLVSTAVIRYKDLDMFLSAYLDITERKKAEMALHVIDEEQKAYEKRIMHLASFPEMNPNPILELDAAGNIKFSNKAATSIFEELHIHPDVKVFLPKDMSQLLKNLTLNKPSSFYREVVVGQKIFAATVHIVPFFGVARIYCADITEGKKNEKRYRILSKQLLKTNKILQDLALKDPHTGLFNYRYLSTSLEADFSWAKRLLHPLSIIMMDIDYFKSINDVYGHQFGDLVLRQLAQKISVAARKYDAVVRYGGEEFVVLSPGTDKQGILTLAQRILSDVNSSYFGNKKDRIQLKLSLAAATYPHDGNIYRSADLINLADMILAKAKEEGGNRICTYSDLKSGAHKSSAENIVNINLLNEKIKKLSRRANQSLLEEISAFAKTIEVKDYYTGRHVEESADYSEKLAQRLGCPEDMVQNIRQAAVLHDLGKIGIREKILLKAGKLTQSEFEEVKKHVQIGADILRPIHALRQIVPYVLYHHERWDGTGYPGGLKGAEIPLGARIISVADVYNALSSDRPYRKAYTPDKAVGIIKEGAGVQFDPKITEIFLDIVEKE